MGNTSIGLKVSKGIVFLGILMTILFILLPQVRLRQSAQIYGPAEQYGNSDYTISAYFIPPIPKGEKIYMHLSNYKANSLILSIFYAQDDTTQPDGTALFTFSNFSGSESRLTVTSGDDRAYTFFITSFNRTRFILIINSVWSPFYFLKIYLPLSFLTTVSGLASYYYLSERRKIEILHQCANY